MSLPLLEPSHILNQKKKKKAYVAYVTKAISERHCAREWRHLSPKASLLHILILTSLEYFPCKHIYQRSPHSLLPVTPFAASHNRHLPGPKLNSISIVTSPTRDILCRGLASQECPTPVYLLFRNTRVCGCSAQRLPSFLSGRLGSHWSVP